MPSENAVIEYSALAAWMRREELRRAFRRWLRWAIWCVAMTEGLAVMCGGIYGCAKLVRVLIRMVGI